MHCFIHLLFETPVVYAVWSWSVGKLKKFPKRIITPKIKNLFSHRNSLGLRISSSSQPFSSNTILKHYLFRFVAYTPRRNGFVHCYYPLKANNLLSAPALNSSRRSVSNLGWMQKFSEFCVFFTLLLILPTSK